MSKTKKQYKEKEPRFYKENKRERNFKQRGYINWQEDEEIDEEWEVFWKEQDKIEE